MAAEPATHARVRVWDIPTRLSHWVIVILFGVCWWSAETEHMAWHRIAGYGVLSAVCFRVAWGFCGGQTARFGSFVRGPAATFGYVRRLLGRDGGDAPAPLGHNPLGALSILTMLALLLVQAVSGLFAVNIDGVASGPLAKWVSFATGRQFAHWHAATFQLLLVMIVVHVAAIVFYRLARNDNLLPAMIHGYKLRASPGVRPYFVSWRRAALLAAAIIVGLAALLTIRW